MIDLEKLRPFIAVYRTRSVLLASKELSLTSAAVSISIKNLEREAGGALFYRVGKKFVPTDFGCRLYEGGSRLVVDIEDLVRSERADKGEVSGKIRVGASNGFGTRVLVPIIRDFQKQFPKVTISLWTGSFPAYTLDSS